MSQSKRSAGLCLGACSLLAAASSELVAAQKAGRLHVGWSSVSITPDKPVALSGQFHTRISKSVRDPVTATALAIEVKGDDGTIDHAVVVSCDLVAIRGGFQEKLRERLAGTLPDLDVRKLILAATHTHTAPVVVNVRKPAPGVPGAKTSVKYKIPKEGVVQVDEYIEFLVDRLAGIVTAAWKGRKPAGVSWALSHAVVGHNRRTVFEGGEAIMYAKTDSPRFRHIEGSADHGLELLFFWDQAGKLTGVAINVACPSQEVESLREVSADFWHDVRVQLRKRYGDDLHVLGLCGPAGDQSPHLLIRKRTEANLRKRQKRSQTEEIGLRIASAVDHVFDAAKGDIHTTVPLAHHVEELRLPARRVIKLEADRAQARVDAYLKKGLDRLNENERTKLTREQGTVARYKHQGEDTYPIELHVLRLGDVAIATNPFELFLDFGLRMKARSRAEQTVLIQLACGSGGYLPTAKAVQGGGYGAEPPSNKVGPEGGRMLVERTVKLINAMWSDRR